MLSEDELTQLIDVNLGPQFPIVLDVTFFSNVLFSVCLLHHRQGMVY